MTSKGLCVIFKYFIFSNPFSKSGIINRDTIFDNLGTQIIAKYSVYLIALRTATY